MAQIRFWPERTILFYPDGPRAYSVLYKVGALAGYSIITDPSLDYDVALQFKYDTYTDPEELKVLRDDRPILNAGCLDISKKKVGEVFEEIFGYAMTVDPATFRGPMVEKSDLNHRKDGRSVTGPLKQEGVLPESIYQVDVDTTNTDGNVVDLRVPIFGNRIPFAYAKTKAMEHRFMSIAVGTKLHETHQLFSTDEAQKLLDLASAMALDYGEMDVLRDNRDGRIYVVDVNNTPSGPAKGLTEEEKTQAMKRLTAEFTRLIEGALV